MTKFIFLSNLFDWILFSTFRTYEKSDYLFSHIYDYIYSQTFKHHCTIHEPRQTRPIMHLILVAIYKLIDQLIKTMTMQSLTVMYFILKCLYLQMFSDLGNSVLQSLCPCHILVVYCNVASHVSGSDLQQLASESSVSVSDESHSDLSESFHRSLPLLRHLRVINLNPIEQNVCL